MSAGQAATSLAPRMTEAQLQRAVTDLCAWRGVWWYHASQPQRDNPGFPDLVLIGGHGSLFVELKTAGGRLTNEQAEVGSRMRKAGLDWQVWRPEDLRSGRVQERIEIIR